jgi:ankyrin repeat protein
MDSSEARFSPIRRAGSKCGVPCIEVKLVDTAGLIEAALSDWRKAAQVLAGHPEAAAQDFHVALVTGDTASVAARLDASPDLIRAPGGPRNYKPLAYACFSHFARAESGRSDNILKTVQLLLERGADPGTTCILSEWPDNPLSCLYAACGLHNNPALAAALLEAGANPDDNESLYHSTEHADLECLRLLLARGASPKNTNALKHMLDREDMAGLRLLLDAGADPNETNQRGETALHWAVWRARSPEAIAALLDHGAAIDATRIDGRTAYALAAIMGQSEVAALLERRGADTRLSDLDRAISDPEALKTLLATRPDIPAVALAAHLLPDFASAHRTEPVRALLAAGLPVDARGEFGATALHWACWRGYADLVEVLLDAGASLAIEDGQYHATPVGWLEHGRENCGEPGGDYDRVAQLLRDAVKRRAGI